MINWKLEVEDVACPVNDMNTTDCSRSFVRRIREDWLGKGGFGLRIDGISEATQGGNGHGPDSELALQLTAWPDAPVSAISVVFKFAERFTFASNNQDPILHRRVSPDCYFKPVLGKKQR